MTENFDRNKYKRISKTIRKFLQGFFWIALTVVFLSMVGLVVIQFLPREYLMLSNMGIDGFNLSMDGLINYRLDAQNLEEVYTGPIFNAITAMAAILGIVMAAVLWYLIKILYSVERDTPFEEGNALRLNRIGLILILSSLLYPAAGGVVAWSAVHTLSIPNIHINFMVDWTILLIGLLVVILGGVFRYGHYLQQEFDATL